MTELSREAILAMVPGRELDAYVAKFAMFPGHSHPLEEVKGWCGNYSTSIASAWEVVEKIANHTNWMLYRIGHTDESGELEYECTFLEVHRGVSGYARAKTAPEAICKAVLTTLEESK